MSEMGKTCKRDDTGNQVYSHVFELWVCRNDLSNRTISIRTQPQKADTMNFNTIGATHS